MLLPEHVAKSLLASLGVPVPRGSVARTPHEARSIASSLGVPVVVKAQVPAIARSRAGGVIFAETPEEAEEVAERMLRSTLLGFKVEKVLVEEKLLIARELYLGVAVDRAAKTYAAIALPRGGRGVEEAVEAEPSLIVRQPIDPLIGFRQYHALGIAKRLGYEGTRALELSRVFTALYRLVVELDAETVEINPLADTVGGRFLAVDVKVVVDEDALFRHPELGRYSEFRIEGVRERIAREAGLSYVELDGDIGVIGNGAGLVMATLDMVALYGGKPANFLDVGGGASPEAVARALEIVLSNPNVRVVLVNILGGITRCDEVAKGVLAALKQAGSSKPIVVRLAGTRWEEGRAILARAGIEVVEEMEEAARRVVELAGRGD